MSGLRRFEAGVFERLAGGAEDDGGLTEFARDREPSSFTRHAGSLAATKVADGLLDPKLVLSWLLNNLGASSVLTGLLVPVREAGSLLPQLFLAPRLHAMARRKRGWTAGSLVQGLACAGIAVAGLTLDGSAAGIVIVALLAVLATGRAACSVSHKDVLRKTIGKTRRGASTGFASSTASIGVIVFALLLVIGAPSRYVLVTAALALAAVLWLLAAAVFWTIDEEPTPSEVTGSTWGQLTLLREDGQLRRFIGVRGLLTATSLAPPYLVLLAAGDGQDAVEQIGSLVLASALASLVSSYVWGRLSDRSSRTVLQLSGLVAAVALGAAVALDVAGASDTWWAVPITLFGVMIAYHGVRQGRSTYLVDMAPKDDVAAYTAVANTVIGVLLIGSGVFGALASLAGPEVTVALFAVMSAVAAVAAFSLREVEGS